MNFELRIRISESLLNQRLIDKHKIIACNKTLFLAREHEVPITFCQCHFHQQLFRRFEKIKLLKRTHKRCPKKEENKTRDDRKVAKRTTTWK